MTIPVPFARRQNQDTTIDSICTRCYQTIAKEWDETDLTIAEKSHACDLLAESDTREEISHYNHRNVVTR